LLIEAKNENENVNTEPVKDEGKPGV